MLASGLMTQGMNWWQALVTILLGNVIVLVPILLNSHPGTKYGIPFPVFARAAYGTVGSNLPALMRALVACGWFGIQAWIGGEALQFSRARPRLGQPPRPRLRRTPSGSRSPSSGASTSASSTGA
jgi:cytosine/uracil/thiamine/allantoin permease